jgi:hypothetical protein
MAFSHSLMCHFISNNTFDLLLTRSERNEDSKGLWIEYFTDDEYADLDINYVI